MNITDSERSSKSSEDTSCFFVFFDVVDERQMSLLIIYCDSCCFMWIIAEPKTILSVCFSFSRYM